MANAMVNPSPPHPSSSKSTSTTSAAKFTGGIKKIKIAPGSLLKDRAAALITAGKLAMPVAKPFKEVGSADGLTAQTSVEKTTASIKTFHPTDDGATPSTPITKKQDKQKQRASAPNVQLLSSRSTSDFDVFSKFPEPKAQQPVESMCRLQAMKQRAPSGVGPLHKVPLDQRMKLDRMRIDAIEKLGQRRAALKSTFDLVCSVKPMAPHIKEAARALHKQMQVFDGDVKKLEQLGRGLQTMDLTGVDPEILVTLASWGSSIEKAPSSDEIVESVELAEVETEAGDVAVDEELFGPQDIEGSSSPVLIDDPSQLSQAVALTSEPTLSPIKPRSVPKPSNFMRAMSRAQRARIPHSVTPKPIQERTSDSKAPTTNLIDPLLADETAKQQAAASRKSSAGQRALKDDSASKRICGGTGGASKPRPTFKLNKNGDVMWDKGKKAVESKIGEKRKRSDMVETSSKGYDDGEGTIKRLRIRQVNPAEDAMEIDEPTAAPVYYF